MARFRHRPIQLGQARDSRGRPAAVTLTTTAGAGITAASGGFYHTRITRSGNLAYTEILIDTTGLNSSTAGDIIGVNSAANCHIGRYTVADSGTIIAGFMQCLETPATGEDDIDLISADEATGTEDAAYSGLTGEVVLVDAGENWTAALGAKGFSSLPVDGQYLYLASSGGGTGATYTAGKFRIVLIGTI